MNISDYIQKLKEQGIRAGDFARKAGIEHAHLSQVLHGKRPRLSLQTMLKIYEASEGEVSHVEDFVVDRNGR